MAFHGARWLLAAAVLVTVAAYAPAQPVSPVTLPSFAPALSRSMPLAFGVYGLEERRQDGRATDDDDAEPLDRRQQYGSCTGAGFFVDASGLAVTAAHVISECRRIAVKLADQRVLLAQTVGVDEDTDIALIRLPVASPATPAFGRTAALRPGDWVLALGEPYALGVSAVAGIVSGKDRHFAEDPELLFIQTDLSLNPGNSGGPLIDAQGAIVGMNMRTVVGTFGTPGVSLSIPIEIVLQVVEDLRAGSIQRPRLGAEFQDLSPATALARGRSHAHGVLIELVRTGSLAQRAGLRVGDIVVGMNGRAIGHSGDFTRALLAWRRATGTRFTVWRAGEYLQLQIE
jgi:serine protease Do